MKYALFFDVDDTLYDQIAPFKKAFAEHFPSFDGNVEEVYLHSRHLSDAVFEQSEDGSLSMEAMHIYRIQGALSHFAYVITDQEALAFQQSYAAYQREISLSQTMQACLDFCQKQGVLLGLITNGPKDHQRRKIGQLGLEKWIKPECIFVSSELGIAKPDSQIFAKAAQQIPGNYQLYYIGDSFTNDILGAYQAKWIPIWLNKRGRKAEADVDFHEVKSEKELFDFLQKLLGNQAIHGKSLGD